VKAEGTGHTPRQFPLAILWAALRIVERFTGNGKAHWAKNVQQSG
jgi:hypothetical protein